MTILAIPPEMRRRLTTSDVIRMFETGVLHENERVELIEGELTLMSPKHNKHEWLKNRLVEWFAPNMRSRGLILASESTLYLGESTYVEPDILIYPRDILPEDVRAGDVRLAIEVSDTSFPFDLKTKAPLYEKFGIAHYWVVDADGFVTYVHSLQAMGGYGKPAIVSKDQALTVPFAPELQLKLGDLN